MFSDWNGPADEELDDEADETVMLDPAFAGMKGSPRRARGSPLANGARKVRFPLGSPKRRVAEGSGGKR